MHGGHHLWNRTPISPLVTKKPLFQKSILEYPYNIIMTEVCFTISLSCSKVYRGGGGVGTVMGQPELETARSDCNTRITHINPLQTRLGVAQMQHTCNELIQGQKTHSLRPNIRLLPNVVFLF